MPRAELSTSNASVADQLGLLRRVDAEPAPAEDAERRRIEGWIVGVVGGEAAPGGDSPWDDLLGKIRPRRKPADGRDEAGRRGSPGGWERFRLARRKDVAVATLSDRALVRDRELSELSGDLLALIRAGQHRLVLDFSGVERMSSWVVAVVAGACRACREQPGGALRVSGLRPELAAIFAITGLDREVEVATDLAAAIERPWPECSALRPLPVEVLAALVGRAGGNTVAGGDGASQAPARLAANPPHEPTRPQGGPVMDHVSLVVESGAAKGRSVSVRGDRLVIGRDPSCRLRLGSATVSRVHAEIGRLGGALILRDLRSSNGTRLNGRLLRGEEAGLADGDRIEVGSIALRVSIRPEPATAAVLARPEIEDQVSSWLGDAPHADPAADPATLADLPAFEADDVADSAAPDADEPVKHEVIEDVLVVTPLVPDLVAEPAIGPLRARLDDLLHSELPMRVVVNLSHVGQISGSAIGVLVAHHLQLDRSGGSLKVCEMNPRVAAVLDQVRLGMIVPCTPTVDEAVLGAWDRPRDAAG